MTFFFELLYSIALVVIVINIGVFACSNPVIQFACD